jgi:hypothetical protein
MLIIYVIAVVTIAATLFYLLETQMMQRSRR